MSTNEAFCPECDYELKLGTRPHKGQRLVCPRCDTNLTVVEVDPLELDWTTAINLKPPKKKAKTAQAICPECDDFIKVKLPVQVGQQVECKTCGSKLEIVDLNPRELDFAMAASGKRNKKGKK